MLFKKHLVFLFRRRNTPMLASIRPPRLALVEAGGESGTAIGDVGGIKGIDSAESIRKITTPIPRPERSRRAGLGSFTQLSMFFIHFFYL